MEINFQGKRAVVTGAGSGIGRDISKALYESGATVYGISLIQAELDSLKAECPNIIIICVDVTDWKVTQEAINNIGPVHLLVNSAGVFCSSLLLTLTEKDYDKTFGVNVKGILCVSQVVAKNMVEHKIHGSIVNLSSTAGSIGVGPVIYNSSKGAVNQITRCMAVELGPHQIRVNAIQPTLVPSTPMGKLSSSAVGAVVEAYRVRTPMQRWAETHNIANLALYLLSDKADMITGALLPVDGGVLCT